MTLLFLLLVVGLTQDKGDVQKETPTPKSIIDKYIAAKGGNQTLAKIKNYVIKGEVVSGGETVSEFEIYQAPNLHLSVCKFPDGSKRSHGTDGRIAWQIDVEGNPSILTGQAARDFIRHYSTLHEALEWSKQFKTIRYAGKKTIEQTPMHHLVFTAIDGRQINRYFAIDSGLFVREEQEFADENETLLISEIKDYVREKNGSLVSHRRVNHFGSKYTVEYRIRSAESNQIKDFKIFAIPASVSKLQNESNPKENEMTML